MSSRTVYDLWAQLGDDERDAFLNALYPTLSRSAQHDRLRRDRRTGAHPDIVLAMSVVLRRRDSALVRFRPVAPPPSQRTIDMPPQPRLPDPRGGMLDLFRMVANTAVLREHQTQVAVWEGTVEKVCRAEAMLITIAVARREAAARMAQAEADIAEAGLRIEQVQTGQNLLADTLPERRDLIRAATTIYALQKGEKK